MGRGATETELALLLKAKDQTGGVLKSTTKDVTELEKAAKGTERALKAMLGVVTGAIAGLGIMAGIKSVLGLIRDMVGEAAKDEQSVLRLAAAVKASGASWDVAGSAIEGYLRAERDRVALEDSLGREALIQMIALTGNYTDAMKLLPIAMDLARGKGMDLVSASEVVGRVSQGNTEILTRYGIQLREGASATEALAQIQQRYAGQAEAWAGSFQGQLEGLRIVWDEIREGIGGALMPTLSRIVAGVRSLLEPIESAIRAIAPLVSDELLAIARAVLPHGENLTASFAKGIANGIPYILAALKLVRLAVEYLLKPGSPPKLLPTLDQWGKGAAESWLSGWTEADFSTLREMSGLLRGALSGLVAEGALDEAAVNPMLRSLRAQIAAALSELRETGAISAGTMGGFTGPTAGYAKAALGAEAADAEVKRIEEQLAKARTSEEVTALAKQLDAARERSKEAHALAETERAKLEMLADESELLRQQVESTKDLGKAVTKLGDDLKTAFDPAAITTWYDTFKAQGKEGAGIWDDLFNPEEINAKAEELAAGWLEAIMPMLDPLRELVGGEGNEGEAARYRKMAGTAKQGGLMGALKSACDTVTGAFRILGGFLTSFAKQDYPKMLSELGFTEDQIKQVENMREAFATVMKAISDLWQLWKDFLYWQEHGGTNPHGLPGGGTIPPYQSGGTVPGPIGMPQLAVVHGGEQVIPVGGNKTATVYQTNNFYGGGMEVAAEMAREREYLRSLAARIF